MREASPLVAGVGMVKFAKPGLHAPYREMGARVVHMALTDANLSLRDVQQAVGAYIYADTAAAQHVLYDVGLTGIPVINVNNACASGSTAIYLARQAVASGEVDCALAFGFEEMKPGALGTVFTDREAAFDRFTDQLSAWGAPEAPLALRCFGAAGQAYLENYNADREIFAHVAVKSRAHAVRNPNALFDKHLTADEVLASPLIFGDYMTRLMACPPTCGAAAAVIVSPDFARRKGLGGLIEIAGQALTTDTPETWRNPMDLVGAHMARKAAEQAYERAGFGPQDIDVIELHDCFTTNEVLAYEALGLCAEGESAKFISDGDNTYGGKYVVNPSGGLMSKGHPIGATGLAQCAELVWQLRGHADARQVENARVGLQHNLGLGGACVVTIYRALNA